MNVVDFKPCIEMLVVSTVAQLVSVRSQPDDLRKKSLTDFRFLFTKIKSQSGIP